MSNTIRTVLGASYLIEGTASPGAIPQRATSVSTSSSVITQSVQIVGTTHEAIAAGDVTDDAMAILINQSDSETITVGGDDAAAFVPWFDIPPGEEAKLPRLSAIAGTYVQASDADTPLLVSLYKVVAPA